MQVLCCYMLLELRLAESGGVMDDVHSEGNLWCSKGPSLQPRLEHFFLMIRLKTDGMATKLLHNLKSDRTCKMLVDWLPKDLDGWERLDELNDILTGKM